MIPFSPRRFNSTVVVHLGTYGRGALGGTQPSYSDSGTTMSAYVEAQSTDVNRDESVGAPVGRKKYAVFTPTDPACVVDSHIVWTADAAGAFGTPRTLGVCGRSVDASGAGMLWRTECEEIL